MPLDDDDKKAIQEMIGAALGGDTLTKAIGGAVGSAVKNLKVEDLVTTKVAEAVKAATPAEKPGKKGKADDDKADDQVSRQLEALQGQLAAEKEAREKAEQQRATDRLHSEVKDALGGGGVAGPQLRAALALLQADGLISLDDEGNPVMKGIDRYGAEGLVPVKDGVIAWLKTDDGKTFLPPVNARGTGDGAPTPTFKAADGSVDVDAVKGDLAKKVLSAAARM